MTMIQVCAADGLRVPLEGQPHEYIGQEPVAVDGGSLYYRRLLAEGSLYLFSGSPKTKTKAKGND